MIKINLLPVKQTMKLEAAMLQLVLLVLVVLAVVVGLYIYQRIRESELDAVAKRVEQTKKEISNMEKIIGEVTQFTDTKKALEDKIKIINMLRKDKTGPVRMMEDLSSRTPPKLWLLEMTESSKSVAIKGQASSDEEVATFLADLQKSLYFSRVQLKFTKASTSGGGSAAGAKDFEITAVVKYSL